MSLAAAFEAPRFFWTRHEVAGNGMSPEIVPTRILSRSAFVRSFLGTAPPVPMIFARFIAIRSPAGEPPSRARPRVVARVQLGDLLLDLLREVAPRELRREPNRVLDGLG